MIIDGNDKLHYHLTKLSHLLKKVTSKHEAGFYRVNYLHFFGTKKQTKFT